jgi:hypothetical protein
MSGKSFLAWPPDGAPDFSAGNPLHLLGCTPAGAHFTAVGRMLRGTFFNHAAE